MKMHRRILTVALLAAVAMPASAQLSGLLGGGSKSGNAASGDIDGNVKTFLDKSLRIETTLNKAALAIVAAYATEEERAQLQAQFDTVGKQTNPKEAGAVFQKTFESAESALKKLAASNDLAERTSKLSADKQAQVAKGLGNFLLGTLQAKDLAPTGQNVMQAAGANPMNLGKVLPVKDALPRLASAASLAGSTLPKLMQVIRGANVQVAEVSASSKEEEIQAI
jgi:hypothetical protein